MFLASLGNAEPRCLRLSEQKGITSEALLASRGSRDEKQHDSKPCALAIFALGLSRT